MICRAESATGAPSGRRSSERGAEQLVDLVASSGFVQAVVQLELDEPHQERIERATGRQELLGDLRERAPLRDHPSQGRYLSARALGVPDGRAAVIARPVYHGDTNAAPVMPAAA